MLRWIVLAVVVVVMVAGATFVSSNATIKEPTAHPVAPAPTGPTAKVEIPEPLIYEFGTMPQLSTGTHAWEFKNVGDADLELWFESSTCSCTVAKLKSENGEEKKRLVVKPKNSTPIDLEWQTKMFHDEYSKGATIGTNDPSHPSVSISVKGKVYPPVIVIPNEMITFGSVSNEELHSTAIAVFSVDRPETKDHEAHDFTARFSRRQARTLDCRRVQAAQGQGRLPDFCGYEARDAAGAIP